MAAWLEDFTWSINPIIRMIWNSEVMKEGVWPWFIGKMLGKPFWWYHPLNTNQPHQYIRKNTHIYICIYIYIGYLHIGSHSPLKPPARGTFFWSLNFLVKNSYCLGRVEGFPKIRCFILMLKTWRGGQPRHVRTCREIDGTLYWKCQKQWCHAVILSLKSAWNLLKL